MTTFLTRSGDHVHLASDLIDGLRASLRGDVVLPDDPGYDEGRAIWNGMIDRRPAAIVECRGAADVAAAVRFARGGNLLFTVRGAGHNIAGNAVADGVLLVDTSTMTGIRVDPDARTVRVEPGCTLRDLDQETQAFGLATPTGINSTTGIAGLTLGGGMGWMSRKHGLTVDNLLEVDLVTAEGERVKASAEENPDLFWAVRGGGGNFGIVTSFLFRLHRHGPQVLSGLLVHPFADAPEVLRAWRDFCADAPDELTAWAVMRKAPPLPFLPPAVHGTEVLILAVHYTGDLQAGEEAVDALRAVGAPIADVIGPHDYGAWQQAFDPLLTPGARNYWKSHNFEALSDEVLDILVDQAGRLPDPGCEVFLAQMGGAFSRTADDATAYVGRGAGYVMNVHGRWEDPDRDEAVIRWAREVFAVLEPHAMGTAYVNFMPDDEADRVRRAYGVNYDRLARVKADWDPENVFRYNQNVPPERMGAGAGAA
jgi:FAD/FMN-containing dehydrogenase